VVGSRLWPLCPVVQVQPTPSAPDAVRCPARTRAREPLGAQYTQHIFKRKERGGDLCCRLLSFRVHKRRGVARSTPTLFVLFPFLFLQPAMDAKIAKHAMGDLDGLMQKAEASITALASSPQTPARPAKQQTPLSPLSFCCCPHRWICLGHQQISIFASLARVALSLSCCAGAGCTG